VIMQTYWDLSEAERAALNEQEVERYIDAELMTKGVLRAKMVQPVDEPSLPEPDQVLYVIGADYHSTFLGFLTAEAATQALRQSVRLDHEYVNGQSIPVACPLGDGHIKEVRVHSVDTIRGARGTVEKATAAKAENERRRETYRRQLDAERDALQGLWEDWHRCRAKAAHVRRIVDVFDDYKRIAGRDDVAGQFLLKVFDRDEVIEASEWCDVTIPLRPHAEPDVVLPSDAVLPSP